MNIVGIDFHRKHSAVAVIDEHERPRAKRAECAKKAPNRCAETNVAKRRRAQAALLNMLAPISNDYVVSKSLKSRRVRTLLP